MAETSDIDITRAAGLTPEVEARVDQLMAYAPWDKQQILRGEHVRDAIGNAMKEIIANVEPCPARTRALNHLIDARMIANQAITFKGRC
jgi:hypothetical protein